MSKTFSRRRVLKAAAIGTGFTFFGPFRHVSYAQGKKPIKLGLTCDASGQYADSGQDDLRGMIMAIDEFNAKGGMLGRKIIYITQDTETTPATGSRVAERFIPTPHMVIAAPEETLRAAGFSRAKVAALKDLAAKTLDSVVPNGATLAQLPDAEIIARLTQVRGIGRWTVEMLLIFHLGRPDVLPVDDFGVRAGFRAAYGLSRMPRPKALATFGERWKPYRTTAAWYLWRAMELKRAGTLPEPAERIRLPRLPRRRRIARTSRRLRSGKARARAKATTRQSTKGAGASSARPRRSDGRTR